MSNVAVMMIPHVVLWMVVWCFQVGRNADKCRGGGSIPKFHHAAVIYFSSIKVNPSVTVHHFQEQWSV